jgi:hypothetical protein
LLAHTLTFWLLLAVVGEQMALVEVAAVVDTEPLPELAVAVRQQNQNLDCPLVLHTQ